MKSTLYVSDTLNSNDYPIILIKAKGYDFLHIDISRLDMYDVDIINSYDTIIADNLSAIYISKIVFNKKLFLLDKPTLRITNLLLGLITKNIRTSICDAYKIYNIRLNKLFMYRYSKLTKQEQYNTIVNILKFYFKKDKKNNTVYLYGSKYRGKRKSNNIVIDVDRTNVCLYAKIEEVFRIVENN